MQEIQMSRKVAAYKIHLDIMAAGEVAAEAFSTFCRLLKTMRDDKLWQELEYSSFETYCENAVGIKQALAYGYIKAYEDFGDENSNRLEKLGIKKLRLLGTVPKEQRDEFMENNNIEEMTSRQIEAAVKDLKEKLKEAEDAKRFLQQDLKVSKQSAEHSQKRAYEAENSLRMANRLAEQQAEESKKVATKLYDLQQQLDQAKRNGDFSKLKELGEKISMYQGMIKDYNQQIGNLNQQLQEKDRQLHEKPIEVAAAKIVEEKVIEKTVIPDEVRGVIYSKVALLYEGLLKLTETEIQIFTEDVNPDYSHDIVADINNAIDVLQGINFVISENTQAV
jgi:chromosome segregation ATPase